MRLCRCVRVRMCIGGCVCLYVCTTSTLFIYITNVCGHTLTPKWQSHPGNYLQSAPTVAEAAEAEGDAAADMIEWVVEGEVVVVSLSPFARLCRPIL